MLVDINSCFAARCAAKRSDSGLLHERNSVMPETLIFIFSAVQVWAANTNCVSFSIRTESTDVTQGMCVSSDWRHRTSVSHPRNVCVSSDWRHRTSISACKLSRPCATKKNSPAWTCTATHFRTFMRVKMSVTSDHTAFGGAVDLQCRQTQAWALLHMPTMFHFVVALTWVIGHQKFVYGLYMNSRKFIQQIRTPSRQRNSPYRFGGAFRLAST